MLCAYWLWSHAKWVEVYMIVGYVARSCGPLGLQTSEAFAPISTAAVGLSLAPEPEDAIDAETRRNLFWLAFSLDRLTGSGNLWPHR